MEWWQIVLTGGVGVALIAAGKELWIWRLNRKAKKTDEEEAEEDITEQLQSDVKELKTEVGEIKDHVETLTESEMIILRDRIRWLAKGYIKAGEIELDDLETLNDMHAAYTACGGNGSLDRVMKDVQNLKLIM